MSDTTTSIDGHELKFTLPPQILPLLSILLKETRARARARVCVCVCVFAKLDQFLSVRSQLYSNQHVNSVRIATFQSAKFGPLLFAFYCPLLFYENKIKNE